MSLGVHRTLFRITIASLFTAISVVSVLAFAYAEEYVGSNASMAAYIAWTADSTGHMQGQIQMTQISSDPAKLTHSNAQFTGTKSGSSISIAFGTFSNFGGQTWTGKTGWGTLTLHFPSVDGSMGQLYMTRGSAEEYQHAVAGLQNTVGGAQVTQSLRVAMRATASQIQSEERALSAALDRLTLEFPNPPAGVENPKTFWHRYEHLWQQMQSKWSKEQTQATTSPLTCYRKSEVAYTASEVSYVLSEFNYLDSEFNSFSSGVQGDFRAVRQSLANLESMYPTFEQQMKAWAAHAKVTPTLPTTIKQRIAMWKARVDSVIPYAMSSFATVTARYSGYDQKAKQLEREAKAFPDTLVCSN